MSSIEFCPECNHEIQANAVKCEFCKISLLSVESFPLQLKIKQEPIVDDVETSDSYIRTSEQLHASDSKPLSHLESEDSKEIRNKEQETSCEIRTNEEQPQPTTKPDKTGDKRHQCDYCNKTYKRSSLLKAHISRLHSKTDASNETVGGTESKTPTKRKCLPNLNKMPIHKPTLKLKLDSDSDVDDHDDNSAMSDDEVETKPLDVQSIPTDLNALYDYLTKLKQTPIGQNVYKCLLCKKITVELRDHLKHIIEHTGQKYNTCLICEDVFIGEVSLDEHMAEAHGTFDAGDAYDGGECLPSGIIKCKDCGESFFGDYGFKRHRRWHAGQLTGHNCNICQISYINLNVLEKHNNTMHDESKNLPKPFKCYICEERFAFPLLLNNHKRSHPEFFELIERTTLIHRHKDSNRILYACRTCGRSTSNQSNHLDHLRTHSSERPFKCLLCSKEFTAKSTLNSHMQLHSDEKKYKCQICSASYRQRHNLRRHLIQHTGERPIKCKYCNLDFFDVSACTDHLRRVHTGETPYQCEICGEWFMTTHYVTRHKLQKHNVDTRMKRTVDILVKKKSKKNKTLEKNSIDESKSETVVKTASGVKFENLNVERENIEDENSYNDVKAIKNENTESEIEDIVGGNSYNNVKAIKIENTESEMDDIEDENSYNDVKAIKNENTKSEIEDIDGENSYNDVKAIKIENTESEMDDIEGENSNIDVKAIKIENTEREIEDNIR